MNFVIEISEKFEGFALDKKFAIFLLLNSEITLLWIHLERFEGLDREVTMILMNNGGSKMVANNLEKFEGLDEAFIRKYNLR